MDPNKHLRNEILNDAGTMCLKLAKTPTSILISGDISYAAHSKEYDFAFEWFEKLAQRCGTKTENIFMVPGNHDVCRKIVSREAIKSYHRDIKATEQRDIASKLRRLLIDPDAGRLLYSPLDQYNQFAGRFFCDVTAPNRTIAKRDLTLNDGSILRLVGLNSALISSDVDKLNDLFVDSACFQITREAGIENLVLCHHPLNWLRNGEELSDHLNDVARIQLFGHRHTNRIDLNRDYIRVAACAAHPDRTENDYEPGYNLLDIEVLGSGFDRHLNIKTHVRIWQSRPGQFRPKMDGTRDTFEHKIRLDEWTKSTCEPGSIVHTPATAIPAADPLSQIVQPTGSDPMDTLRNISIRFFKLNLSQKSAIANKLGLLEDEDMNQPDFERFRRVLLRAQDRGLTTTLDDEIRTITAVKATIN